MNVRVVATRPNGIPLQGTKIEIISTETQKRIGPVLTTDHGGSVVASDVTGPFFPKVRISGDDHRVLVTGFGNYLNADYVVDSNGFGTHAALEGASGARAAAIATGASKFIWICSTHVEPEITATQSLDAMVAGQVITIVGGSQYGPVLPVGASISVYNTATLDVTPTPQIVFRNVRFSVGSTFTANLFNFQSAGKAPNVELENVSFVGAGTWRYIAVNGVGVSGSLCLRHVTGTMAAVVTEGGTGETGTNLGFNGNTGASTLFSMRQCVLTATNLIFRVADTHTEPAAAVSITDNDLVVSSYGVNVTYLKPFVFSLNRVTNAYNGTFLKLDNAGVNNMGYVSILGNVYDGSGGGNSTKFLALALAAGVYKGVSCTGNTLIGPGGTSIAINVTGWTNAVQVEPNAFYNWGTKVFGVTTEYFGAVTVDGTLTANGALIVVGTLTASIAHSSLTGLVYPADDHTQYAALLGRGTQVGNIFSGYASWGTGGAAYSSVVLGFTPAAYWRMGEASGQPQDSSGNAQHTTALGGTPTYSQDGAIVGDTNKAILLDGSTEYFTAPDSATLDLGATFTIVGWIKRASIGTLDTIISKGVNGYHLRVNASNKLELLKENVASLAISTPTILSGSYYFVAAVKSPGVIPVLYVNGAAVALDSSAATDTANTAAVLTIGRRQSGSDEYFDGTLDEIALFSTALTAANISAIYQAGAGLGSSSAPTNTTAGDVTCVRLNVGNVLQVAGVAVQVTGGDIGLLAQNGLRLYDGDSSNYIALKADAARTTDITYLMPAADPIANQALMTGVPAAGVATTGWETVVKADGTVPLSNLGVTSGAVWDAGSGISAVARQNILSTIKAYTMVAREAQSYTSYVNGSSGDIKFGGINGTAQTAGYNTIGGSTRTNAGDVAFGSQFTAVKGRYTSMLVYVSASASTGSLQGAIYQDDGFGSPTGAPIAQSLVFANVPSAAGWRSMSFGSGGVDLDAGTYWFVILSSPGVTWTYYYDAGAAGQGVRDVPMPFANGAPTWPGGGTFSTDKYSIYFSGNTWDARFQFDNGDYLRYVALSNSLQLTIGNANKMEIDTGARFVNYLRVGSLTAPANTADGDATFDGILRVEGDIDHNGANIGFYGTAPAAKPTVTGSRGGNAALASLLTGLAGLGLITDSSSA